MITAITLLFATIMLFLTVKDVWSFRNGQHINYKSAIVSLGILGTFIGIFLGLWEFNTENIANSVPQLLEGLKLAFLTSIMGMGLSILLDVLQAQPEQPTDKPVIQRLDIINQTLSNLSNQWVAIQDIEELQTLVNEESPLDKRYFPHLEVQESAWYSTSTPDSIAVLHSL